MSTDSRTQVLQAIDLVELISQSVALKRRGRSFVGLCPFHQEKTPSFHVNPSRQTFYCFGCKASGTAFDFVMRRDRVEFREALEILARQAGIELPQFGGSNSKEKASERQALLDAHSAACQFFVNQLQQPQGEAARAYLAKRGFTPETISRFQVGLAPDGWDGLLRSPVGRKFSPQLLVSGGLVKARQSGDGFYDTFRNRIMFPIRNEGGQIIAFGGRVMPGSDDPAKYLNSPETPLFLKSKAIFGIDFARQRIVETRTVAVVEGYTDTVMAHQFGATNVVSVLGTAMTEQHVQVLRRFADRIVLLFDADAAGDAAVDRVVGLFLTQPIEIAVASIPQGMDPDEFLLANGLEIFDQLLANASDALSYAWKQMRRQFESHEGDLTGQQKSIEQYLELLSQARAGGPVDSIRWGAVLARVTKLTGIPTEELNRRFKARRPTPSRMIAQAVEPSEPKMQDSAPEAGPRIFTAQDRAERRIMGIMLLEPQRWLNVQQALHVEDFASTAVRRLAEFFWNYQRDEGESVLNELLAALPDDGLKALAIELVDEVEELSSSGESTGLDRIQIDAMSCLSEGRRQREQQKLVALGQSGVPEEQQLDALRRLQEAARQPDMRRLGPRS